MAFSEEHCHAEQFKKYYLTYAFMLVVSVATRRRVATRKKQNCVEACLSYTCVSQVEAGALFYKDLAAAGRL